ncbi:tetratricopeptide repeat protein [Virgibacillus salarius]|uniref:tetratricopeptide repeat protein n=1 Tax=Virgibacillus salarius TaxID=447199 RepID=UPI0031D1DA9D
MSIGLYIKNKRKRLNLTQEEVCLGICSIPYLSKVENNSITASKEILLLLCKKLKIPYEKLEKSKDPYIDELLITYFNAITNKNSESAIISYKQIIDQYFALNQDQKNIFLLNQLLDLTILRKDLYKANKLLIEIENNLGIIITKHSYHYYKNKAILLLKQNKIPASMELFELAVKNVEQYQPDGDFYYFFAIASSKMECYCRSIEMLNKAKAIYIEQLDLIKIMNCHILLGINYMLVKEMTLAKEYLNISLKEVLNQGDKKNEARILHNLGYLEYKEKNWNTAVSYLNRCLNIKGKNYSSINTIYLLYLIRYKHLGMEITKDIKMAYDMAIKSRNEEYIIKFKTLIINSENGFYSEDNLTFLLKKAIPFFNKNGDRDDYKFYLKMAATIFESKGFYKKAVYYYKLALEIGKEFNHEFN